MVTILDVNDIPPVFAQPWTKKNPYYVTQIQEELPVNTVLGTFTASDADSEIDHYAIEPESEYFVINETTGWSVVFVFVCVRLEWVYGGMNDSRSYFCLGTVYTKKRIDYEEVQNINFTIQAYDSGRPQLSAAAHVIVKVLNINDMSPTFDQVGWWALCNKEGFGAGGTGEVVALWQREISNSI